MGLPFPTVVAYRPTGLPPVARPLRRGFRRARGDGAWRAAFLLAPLLLAPPVMAAPLCPETYQPFGRVVAVNATGELTLENGRIVRLAAIDKASSRDDTAFASALRDLALHRPISVAAPNARTDRYGRLAGLARVETADGQDPPNLQTALLERGLAVARPETDFLGCMPMLVEAEHPARERGLGVWSHLPIRASDITALDTRRGGFTIMAGRVLTVGTGRGVDYLNFGAFWRKDATVRLEKSISRALERQGLALAEVAGRDLAVRGHVTESGGPAITIRWIEQIAAVDGDWDRQEAGEE